MFKYCIYLFLAWNMNNIYPVALYGNNIPKIVVVVCIAVAWMSTHLFFVQKHGTASWIFKAGNRHAINMCGFNLSHHLAKNSITSAYIHYTAWRPTCSCYFQHVRKIVL